MRWFRRVGLAVVCLAPGPAMAQSELPGMFGEVLEVRVVNVEVVVTDRKGIRVRGLGADDFTLVVDGEEVPIAYFSEIQGGAAIPGSQGRSFPEAVPAARDGRDVGVSYLVFIDDFFSRATERNQVLEALRQQLAYLGPEDRMAIVAYDGRELEMLSSWSQSQAVLDEAFMEAAKRPAGGLQRLAELRSLERSPSRSMGRGSGFSSFDRLSADESFHVDQILEQVGRTTGAAAASLRGFANPPGRKVGIVLSGGWPVNTAEFVINDFRRVISPSERGDATPYFERLADTANRLGYTLYTVDVPGLDRVLADASRFGATPPGSSVGLREIDVHYGLELVAGSTGGQAFLNSRRLAVVEEVALDTKSYYWLGFVPEQTGSNERHEIRVEVVNSRLEVRGRTGFLDLSRSDEVTHQVESALLFGNPPSSASFAMELGEPVRSSRRRVDVPLRIAVPFDEITLVPDGDDRVARVELRVAVKDASGTIGPIEPLPLTLKLEGSSNASTAEYETTLTMRREPHDLVVTVFDVVSGKLLAAEARIDP